ncbi:MAG: hypothetical protein CL840_03110 [Crocinitomicaceae bacterium]|jgi:hypothetical protein|nr:hypothetical protein [Crocinitomicaceae bacterium]|tara:strand:- start:365825 stop:366043 length:219 start_codon:yes stop_codon:yes gene_type:complete
MAKGRKIRPFGTYGINDHDWPRDLYDVADCQNFLPKGARIRNKKAKRRLHNKRTRHALKSQTYQEVEQALAA